MAPNQFLIGLGAFVLLVAFLVFLFTAARQRQQTAIRKALIDKFGAAQDLGAFLQSPGGDRFISGLFTGTNSPAQSVLASIHKGVIILVVGLGVMALGLFTEKEAYAIGGLLVALGLGFLISAAVTHHLSKRWGLLDGPTRN